MHFFKVLSTVVTSHRSGGGGGAASLPYASVQIEASMFDQQLPMHHLAVDEDRRQLQCDPPS